MALFSVWNPSDPLMKSLGIPMVGTLLLFFWYPFVLVSLGTLSLPFGIPRVPSLPFGVPRDPYGSYHRLSGIPKVPVLPFFESLGILGLCHCLFRIPMIPVIAFSESLRNPRASFIPFFGIPRDLKD